MTVVGDTARSVLPYLRRWHLQERPARAITPEPSNTKVPGSGTEAVPPESARLSRYPCCVFAPSLRKSRTSVASGFSSKLSQPWSRHRWWPEPKVARRPSEQGDLIRRVVGRVRVRLVGTVPFRGIGASLAAIHKWLMHGIEASAHCRIFGHSRESRRRRCHEIDGPDTTATPEFRAMRGWYQFAPHVRSRTQVIVLAG